MQVFKKILCPLDFSDSSREAFNYAKVFAETFHSELIVLHVCPSMTEAYTALMPEFADLCIQKDDDLLEEVNRFTDDWKGRYRKVIRAGSAYLEILDFAESEKVDLIVLGAKGLTGFERLFVGSTGEKVARKSSCPVLTVHEKTMGLKIKKILLPIDFSHLSYAVIPLGAAIAEKFQAEISLLHVVELGDDVAKDGQKKYEFFERIKTKLADQWAVPDEFNKIVTQKFIRHHVGSAGYGIRDFAQDWDIDLIAMATHGRSGLSKVLMGSVTEKVVKIAPCPVLSIRSQL